MLRVRAGGMHDGAIEVQVTRLFKRNEARAGEADLHRGANGCDCGFNGRWIDGGGFVAGQSENDCTVCGVSDSSEGKRAVEVNLDAHDAIQLNARPELAGKATGCAHGAHRVRTGRANTDLVEVEEARGHA